MSLEIDAALPARRRISSRSFAGPPDRGASAMRWGRARGDCRPRSARLVEAPAFAGVALTVRGTPNDTARRLAALNRSRVPAT